MRTTTRAGASGWLAVAILLAAASTAVAAPARKWTEVVQYGPHKRQYFVIWHSRVGGDAPKPVYVHFFGGAFLFGSPSGGPFRDQLLQQGVTVVGGGYRFRQDGVTKREILEDGARVIQYLRANAAKYYIDPRRIGVGGFSSGGVVAAWVALHNDLANPKSPDPVLRQSSRVSVCCLEAAQVHPIRLGDWVRYTGSDRTLLQQGIFNYILLHLYGTVFRNPIVRSNYATEAEYQQALWAYRFDTFPFYLCSPDDPPVCFLTSASDDPNRYVRMGDGGGLHSPLLMIPMKRLLEEWKVPVLWGRAAPCLQFILKALKPPP